jgi:Leucine-rich repeat (LRR) protein
MYTLRKPDCRDITSEDLSNITRFAINSADLRPGDFNGFSALEKLNITSSVPVYKKGVFEGLTALKILDIKCYLAPRTKIDSNALSDLRAVKSISLTDCNLDELERGAFVDIPNLETLQLGDNKIRIIGDGAFSNLPSLKILDLQRNNILYLPTTLLTETPELRELNLSSNIIGFVKPTLFSGLRKLRKLILSKSEISGIVESSFSELGKLEWLDLSKNIIYSLTPRLGNTSNNSQEWFSCPKCSYKADGPIGNTCPGCNLTKEEYASEEGAIVCD